MNPKPAASEPGWDSGSHCDLRQDRAAGRALNVADACCGAGAEARLWAAQGHQVYGADSDAAQVALARRRAAAAGLEIMFDHAAATALPWPDRSMDVCIAPAQLAKMTDWRRCAAELVRVLRPGGVLCIRTTSTRFPVLAWFACYGLRRHFARHGLRVKPA
jgi:2-polyprenyl-6-hydroxyphenyl methylase/3-demethylubiquinone-9 3-methyltransferase